MDLAHPFVFPPTYATAAAPLHGRQSPDCAGCGAGLDTALSFRSRILHIESFLAVYNLT